MGDWPGLKDKETHNVMVNSSVNCACVCVQTHVYVFVCVCLSLTSIQLHETRNDSVTGSPESQIAGESTLFQVDCSKTALINLQWGRGSLCVCVSVRV